MQASHSGRLFCVNYALNMAVRLRVSLRVVFNAKFFERALLQVTYLLVTCASERCSWFEAVCAILKVGGIRVDQTLSHFHGSRIQETPAVSNYACPSSFHRGRIRAKGKQALPPRVGAAANLARVQKRAIFASPVAVLLWRFRHHHPSPPPLQERANLCLQQLCWNTRAQ